MASPIKDVGNLPGQTVSDQEGVEIGKVKDVYKVDENAPMWVTIEASTGMKGNKVVFVPLARLKEEEGTVSVPYSADRIKDSPEVEAGDEISEEDDRRLRDYYAIDHADQEFRTEAASYASRVPEPEHQPQKVDDPESEFEKEESDEEDSDQEGRDSSEEDKGEEGPQAKGSEDESQSEGSEDESQSEGSEDDSESEEHAEKS